MLEEEQLMRDILKTKAGLNFGYPSSNPTFARPRCSYRIAPKADSPRCPLEIFQRIGYVTLATK